MIALAAAVSLHAQGGDTKAIQLEDLYSPNSAVKETTITPGDVERFHGRLIHTNTNTYLSSAEVNNDFYKKYVNAQKLQDWGQYIWGLGASYAASSMVSCIRERSFRERLLQQASGCSDRSRLRPDRRGYGFCRLGQAGFACGHLQHESRSPEGIFPELRADSFRRLRAGT